MYFIVPFIFLLAIVWMIILLVGAVKLSIRRSPRAKQNSSRESSDIVIDVNTTDEELENSKRA